MPDSIRIDKWLWAMRIYKTRTDAAEACKLNRVKLNDSYAKASREVKIGDIVSVTKLPITYSFKVLDIVGNRQPAKNVPDYMLNVTPQEEIDKLNIPKETIFISRDRGTGRPTKKDRREMDSLMDTFFWEDE